MGLRVEFKLKLNRLCVAPFKLDFVLNQGIARIPTAPPNCHNSRSPS